MAEAHRGDEKTVTTCMREREAEIQVPPGAQHPSQALLGSPADLAVGGKLSYSQNREEASVPRKIVFVKATHVTDRPTGEPTQVESQAAPEEYPPEQQRLARSMRRKKTMSLGMEAVSKILWKALPSSQLRELSTHGGAMAHSVHKFSWSCSCT